MIETTECLNGRLCVLNDYHRMTENECYIIQEEMKKEELQFV